MYMEVLDNKRILLIIGGNMKMDFGILPASKVWGFDKIPSYREGEKDSHISVSYSKWSFEIQIGLVDGRKYFDYWRIDYMDKDIFFEAISKENVTHNLERKRF